MCFLHDIYNAFNSGHVISLFPNDYKARDFQAALGLFICFSNR